MASADNRIGDSLHRRLDALHEAERRILDKVRRPARVAVDTQAKHDEQTTFGENTADNPGRSAS